jgi:integrase
LRAFNAASDKAGLTVKQVRARDGKEIDVRVSPHDLRHSAATLAYDGGLELREVSELLRHASTAVTDQVYLGRIGSETKRKQALGARLAAALPA